MEKINEFENTFPRNYFTYVEVLDEGVDTNCVLHDFDIKNALDDSLLTSIHFQQGNPFEVGVNGIRNEDLLRILIERVSSFKKSNPNDFENDNALSRLYEAYWWLSQRKVKHRKEVTDKLSDMHKNTRS